MRINYTLNENNEIVSWTSYPIDVTKPYVDIAAGVHIDIGIDKVVNGEFVKVADDSKLNRIAELKRLLAESDYQCLKHADGELTDEEYASVKAQRHAWRVEINELQGE